ncbi:MAG: patatin-like phospholipase family protein, partial [Candidatus Dormibacteraeota bacterium]|nr:patatin-like phospholipase family protein [Candidatus Dormibacteraeota bacterium]
IYVGTSAGAFVATLLSNGISPRALVDMARNPSLALQWSMVRHVFSPNLGDVGRRLAQLPRHVPPFLADLLRHRGSFLISDILGFLSLALPTGLLDSSQVGAFMREILELADMPTEFDQVDKELYVVACELDTWQRKVFGRDTSPRVSIPEAVAASSAIPIVFRPVRINGIDYIDGGVKGAAAVDVAIDRGAELIVVVNALAPLDVRGIREPGVLHRFGRTISDLGIKGVANQVARGILKDTLSDHVRLVREQHPEVDIVVIEPLPNDEKMFFHEVMSTSARLVVAQHGYESVLDGMARNDHFASVMNRHGIEISPTILDARPWSVSVRSIETGELPERLQQTVFGGRRPKETQRVIQLARAIERVEAQVQTSGQPVVPADEREEAKKNVRAAAPRRAAGPAAQLGPKRAAPRRGQSGGKRASSTPKSRSRSAR